MSSTENVREGILEIFQKLGLSTNEDRAKFEEFTANQKIQFQTMHVLHTATELTKVQEK